MLWAEPNSLGADQVDVAPVLFTVTDVKQFVYCGRVIFYEHCLPHVRPRTYKMDAGRAEHEDEQKRAARRNLSRYALGEGKRAFDVAITAPKLQLTGLIDEVVYAADGEVFPVDYKLAKKVAPNHQIQLAAYALLLESVTLAPVKRAFLYLIPLRKMEEVAITPTLRAQVLTLLDQLTVTVQQERMPSRAPNPHNCIGCEFRRFCNDV